MDSAGAAVGGATLSLNGFLSLSRSDGSFAFQRLSVDTTYELKASRDGLASGVRLLRISSEEERVSIRLVIGPRIQFEDVTAKAGLDFTLATGATGRFYQPEIMGGGVAALDFDADGCTDIFFVNGAELRSGKKTGPAFHNKLYRNNCNGTFRDVTAESGLAGEVYGMGAGAADFDNDGFPDLLVTGLNGCHLYRNRGNGTFQEVTAEAGLGRVKDWTISAGWFDYDNDGWLDLFLTTYVEWDPGLDQCSAAGKPFYCHPRVYRPLANRLFHNNRNGTFTDVSGPSGIGKSLGKGMGVAFGDYDGDGWTDVFVANDSVPNFLFKNLGNGKFQEVALQTGVAYPANGNSIAGMGADFRDLNNDGHDDIAMTAMYFETFPLFRNQGKPAFFRDDTVSSGVALATRNLTGWGMGIYDFDNDGNKDVFFATSHFPGSEPYVHMAAEIPNHLLLNAGNGTFTDVSESAGSSFQQAALFHGAAFADFDNDGRVDVIVTASNARARLYRNVSAPADHWIAFRLRGKTTNRDGIGARIQVTLPNGSTRYNRVTTSVGYASSSEPVVRFGLGPYDRVKQAVIRWPGGQVQILTDLPSGSIHAVTEGEKR